MNGKISLYKEHFSRDTKTVLNFGKLSAETFVYSTGVEAIRIKNDAGYAIILPYMGQMVWDMEFFGHRGTMRTMYDEPMPCNDTYKGTYGCFVMHCGLSAMGNPKPEDTHLPHGELPVAQYQSAYILFGEDEKGRYIAISGEYEHKRCYAHNYLFRPECRLYEGEGMMEITAYFENRRTLPLEYFYLCHINYRPVDGATLHYTAKHADITPHHEVPIGHHKEAETNAYLEKLDKNPALMDVFDSKTQSYSPEIVFTCKYFTDDKGDAHTMELLPDGYACYVRHRPEELPFGIRWISRTEDEDALGMVLPATAEHFGYIHCKKMGYERYLKKGESVTYRITTGILKPEDAQAMKARIESLNTSV